MFEQVKQEIDNKIKTNGNNEITATRLNGVLQDMMDATAEELNGYVQKTDPPSPAVGDLVVFDEFGGFGTSEKTVNDFATAEQGAKADTALQPTGVKTINNQSIVGSGNITIEGGGTEVEANPSGEATTRLRKIKIGETNYELDNPFAGEVDATDAERLQALANMSNQEAGYDSSEPHVFTGKMGYVVLQPEKEGDATTTFAAQIANKPNTIFDIRDVFDLDGDEVEIPANCTLKFNGGLIKNGTIIGEQTTIESKAVTIFSGITFSGSWTSPFVAEWLLPKYDENADYTDALTYLFNCGANVIVFTTPNVYSVSDTIVINDDVVVYCDLVGYNGNQASRTYPVIKANDNITVIEYNHRNYRKVIFGGLCIKAGDSQIEDYTTPIVKFNYLASGWEGTEIDLSIIAAYSTQSYDGVTYSRLSMVGIEVSVSDGYNFTLANIKGSIFAYKGLYIHKLGSGYITDITIDARIEANYGGEINGNQINLRGQFQPAGFPNNIPSIRPSECFFYGGTNYFEDSFIWDLDQYQGDTGYISSLRFGTDGSVVARTNTNPNSVSLPNLPTRQTLSLVNYDKGVFTSVKDLISLNVTCSQDDFSTTIFDNNDIANIDGLFSPTLKQPSQVSSSLTELDLYRAFILPSALSKQGFDSNKPIKVKIVARYTGVTNHWMKLLSTNALDVLEVVHKQYSDDSFSTLVTTSTYNPIAQTGGLTTTERNALVYLSSKELYHELTIVYNLNKNQYIVGTQTFALYPFNIFNYASYANKQYSFESKRIVGDWFISRGEYENYYYPHKPAFASYFTFVAPTTLGRYLAVEFEYSPMLSGSVSFSDPPVGEPKRSGWLYIKTNGDIYIGGITRTNAVKVQRVPHTISGYSYYKVTVANAFITIRRIIAQNIILYLERFYPDGYPTTQEEDLTITGTIKISGLTGERPTSYLGSAIKGYQYYDVSLLKYICWNGSTWTNLDGTPITDYTVTKTGVDSHIIITDGNISKVEINKTYIATLEADTGFNIDTVTVKMGGIDISSFVYNNGVIYIAGVTGNIVITATTTQNI